VQPNPEYRARRRPNKPRAKPQFAAIILLLEGAEAKVHPGLRKIFSNYVFCGCVDSVMALIQFETKLFVTNTSNLTYGSHFFVQQFIIVLIYDFPLQAKCLCTKRCSTDLLNSNQFDYPNHYL
jgi:hypothetical protein